MTTTIEQELGRAIEAEAGRIAEAGPDFFAAVSARTARRRRRRRRGAVAALAVATAAGVGVAAVAAIAIPDRRTPIVETTPTTTLASSEPPDAVGADQLPNFEKAADVAKVWPAAVTTLPATLPNEADYVVQAVLPGARYLVLESRTELPGFTLEHPSIFEPATGTLRRLTDPSAVVGYTQAGVSGANAVWVVSVPGTSAHEIWTAPLAGGPARRLISLPNVTADKVFVDGFTIVGDVVMWHARRDGNGGRENLGIRRIPVAGGAVQAVPNTAGFMFTRYYSGMGGAVAIAERSTGTGGELLDLATGRRTTWTRAPGTDRWPYIHCAPVWCVGDATTSEYGPMVQRPDSSGLLTLDHGSLAPIGDGRFLTYCDYAGSESRLRGMVVWDRKTGRVGVLSIRQRIADIYLGRPFLVWTDGDALKLLDLTKIT
jgi:hypothetical protein